MKSTHNGRSQFFALTLAGGVWLALAGCDQPQPVAYRIPKEQPPAAGAPQQGMMALPGMAESSGAFATPHMTAPAHWESKDPGQLRRGSWNIPNPNGEPADVSVIVFPDDVGGLEANINRWRQQIGLAPAPVGELEAIEVDGHTGVCVKLVGDRPLPGSSGPKATLGWIVAVDKGTWFFKVTGDRDHVLTEEPAFLEFIRTVRFAAEDPPAAH